MFASKTTQIALALTMPASVIIAYWIFSRWSSDEECYGETKVTTSHTVQIKVKVPRKAVGTVIGKQGATIKKIQTATSARLHFSEKTDIEDGKPKELVIVGTAHTAQQAEVMVLQVIAEMPKTLTEEIQVPQCTVGRIIGKGGVVIRDIRHASGIGRIDFDRNYGTALPGEMKNVTLSGSRQQIDVAIELIEEIVKNAEIERAEKDKSPSKSTFVPRERRTIKATAIPIEEDETWNAESDEEAYSTIAELVGGGDCHGPQVSDGQDYIQVMVSAVEHPGHFWVQVVGAMSLHLEQLQNDITKQLESETNREELAVTDVQPGDLVAAKFEEGDPVFYRARVVRVDIHGQVDLYFLDYGDNVFVNMDKIYTLRPQFHHFPHQAIECRLANVEPLSGSLGWTEDDITFFEDLVHCARWKTLFAKTMTYVRVQGQSGHDDGQGKLRPCLQLIDTNQKQDLDIGQALIDQGHARSLSTTHNGQPDES